MKTIAFLTLAILAGVSLTTMGAQAQDRPRSKPAFTEIDANGDGGITPEELRAYGDLRGQARFTQTDIDGDGLLTRDELLARGAEQAGERIDRMIGALDSDADGMISLAEMEARKDGGERRGGDAHRAEDQSGEKRGGRGARMFERADADSDGSLSAAEWDAIGLRGGRGRN